MRVVVVTGTFVADPRHLELVADRLDFLSVYGTTDTRGLDFVPTPPSGCRYRKFSRRGWISRGPVWWSFPGLGDALDEDRPEIVHVVSEPWGFLALQVCRWARSHPDVKIVIHGCDRIWWHGSSLERAMRKFAASRTVRAADAFAAESIEAIERAREVGLPPSAPTAQIHTNPRDESYFALPAPLERRSSRARLGLDETALAVGFLGRLIPEKGPLVFLAAATSLESSGREVVFVIAGDGPLRPYLASLAESDPRVRVLGSLSYPDEVRDFYRAIDVFVIPSYTTAVSEEQSPRTVIEAMMSGCLVVGTTCGAIPSMVGEFGLISAEHDAQALRVAISSALERISDNSFRPLDARRHAIDRYSAGATAALLESLWKQTLGE